MDGQLVSDHSSFGTEGPLDGGIGETGEAKFESVNRHPLRSDSPDRLSRWLTFHSPQPVNLPRLPTLTAFHSSVETVPRWNVWSFSS